MKNKKRRKRGIAVKSICGLISLLILFAVTASVIGYREFTEALLDQYEQGAFRSADAAALAVDGDKMETYKNSQGRGQTYLDVWNRLDRICNATDATFIYVITPDLDDYAHITFWFSTINREYDYTKYDFAYYRETTNDEYKEKYRKIMEEGSEREVVLRDQGYIETDPHITAMIPVKTRAGEPVAILCVQRQMDVLVEARNEYLEEILIAFIVLAVLVISGQWLYLHRMLLRPIGKITQEASRFAQENVTTGEKLTDTIHNTDEIGMLAASIDQMESQVQEYVAHLTEATAKEERISTELSLATRIQKSMLPREYPAFPDRKEFDIYATMRPAREVGGDFYDYFLIDEDHLCLVMADVSGKGIPAALFMMASKITLKNNAMQGKSPAEILKTANEAIAANNELEMFVTVWLGILELSTGKLVAANAGHEYPVVQQAGGAYELMKDKHGFVIGGMTGMTYTEYEIPMTPGAKLFVYTDGVPEATNRDNAMFGTARMVATLNGNTQAAPEQVLGAMQDAVNGFVGDAEQFDDLTMLCLEYKGNGSPD